MLYDKINTAQHFVSFMLAYGIQYS